MNNYYNEIESLIKKNEINKRARYLKDNSETLRTYWEIGRLIVEAQGGENRAKYVNALIENWSKKLTNIYGSGYKISNLKYMRKLYLLFPKSQPLVDQLTWTHYLALMPIKDENKRNYYINLCITNNLSKRELIEAIKNNSYERLLDKPEHIEILNEKEEIEYNIREHIKNPIIIKLNKEDKILKEKDLELKILAKLQNFFTELGYGYTLVGNAYKIKYGNTNYFIDILLFNVEQNCYLVVELKMRELKKEDKAQIEFYMNAIDQKLKKNFHNRTKGIIVTKYQDKFILNFINSNDIIPVTYLLKEIN